MYALRIVLDRPARFLLTVGGVALCVILMLFLWSVHRGVERGSLEYLAQAEADVWVLQRNVTNVLRGSSMLPAAHEDALRAVPGVAAVAPLTFGMAGLTHAGRTCTLFLVGFDPATGRGRPPALSAGRSVEQDGEIVLDERFATKQDLAVGDRVAFGETALRVVGLSAGTNMFVIQYAFTSLAQAQRLAGAAGIVSSFLVSAEEGRDPARLAATLRERLPVAAYTRTAFLANNRREVEAGVLPLLFTLALIGAVVLTLILSLILSVNVLERRQEFAVLKALGAPRAFIPGVVVQQALWMSVAGAVAGALAFLPLSALTAHLAPEITTSVAWDQAATLTCAAVLVSLVASYLPVRRLRHVYPMEVFR